MGRELEEVRQQLVVTQQENAKVQDLARQLEESHKREEQLREQVAKMEPSTETGSLQKIAGAGAEVGGSEPERATAMLTLAMQLHDQYVDKGKAKANQIVEESQARYNEIVTKADDYSNRTRSEADEYNKQTRGDADDYSVRTRSDADAYAARAHNEADAYSGKVRQAADDYSKQTHDQADQYESEVQHRAADYDSTTRTAADAYARQVRENLEKQTKVIEGNIQSLKQFETEYRTRLTDFLGQLVAQVSDENTYSSMENQDQQDQK